MSLLKRTLLKFFSIHADLQDSTTAEADAIILECSHTGITREDCKEIRILLQVMPHNGRNFVAECKPLIKPGQEQILHSGYKMKVTIDPKYPHRILMPMFD